MHLLEEGRRERGHEPIDERAMAGGIVALSPCVPLAERRGVGLVEMRAGLVVAFSGIEDLGQAEVQRRPFSVGQVRIGQQLAHGGQVALRQLVAQQRGQLRPSADVLGIVAQGLTKTAFCLGEVVQLLAEGAQVAVGRGEAGLQAQSRAVALRASW